MRKIKRLAQPTKRAVRKLLAKLQRMRTLTNNERWTHCTIIRKSNACGADKAERERGDKQKRGGQKHERQMGHG